VSLTLKPYAEYKSTSIGAVERIPEHWQLIRAKYVMREVDERSVDGHETHLSMNQKRGLIPAKDSNERRLFSESYAGGKKCKRHDLVLNRLKAHLGVFAHASLDGVVSPGYTVLRCLGQHRSKFFEYQFRTPEYITEFRRATKGIVEGFWRLYTDDFYRIAVAVPPVSEQDEILSWIGQFDRIISRLLTAKRRLIALLRAQMNADVRRLLTVGIDAAAPTKPASLL